MNKKIKSKKIHKTKLSKKLKSKSKSYKKIYNKKISNRKKYNKKNYSKKIYRGGANTVPKSQPPTEKRKANKIALFFDNEIKNFVGLENCLNVIQIKVKDNNKDEDKCNKGFYYDNIMEQVKEIEKFDTVEPNTYTNYINCNSRELLWFDGVSGITTEQLNSLCRLFESNKDFDKITDIILDFDRTFTLTEGLFALPNILAIAKHLYKNKSPEITYEEHANNFVNLIMGGKIRREAMKNFLNICKTQNKKITILTNNVTPLINPEQFPSIINLILGENYNKNFIRIISTKDKDGYLIATKSEMILDNIYNPEIDAIDLKITLKENIEDLDILL
jgi:hypothetical protein